MKRYHPEPAAPQHGGQTGVILINLGTPSAPTAAAVRPYLRQFLSDPRVVELPKMFWQPLLRGLILPLRGKKSAANYKRVWLKEGSPLLVYSRRQAKALADRLPDSVHVRCAMTYGLPEIDYTVAELKAQGVDKILAVPLFPQYAASSSGAALDAVYRAMMRTRNQPSVRTVRSFHNDPGYIEALRRQVSAYWQEHGRGGHLLVSFHGIPQAQADAGDPYPDECRETARLLAAALGLSDDEYTAAFQSRFGGKWLEPAIEDLLKTMPQKGIESLDVVCPAFVSDCLETMEEIAVEGRETFHEAGGRQFRYIPCLNDNPDWIDALAAIVRREAAGWL